MHNFETFGYLPTEDTTAKVTPNDLDLLFQRKQFEVTISAKVRGKATCEVTSSIWRFGSILVL